METDRNREKLSTYDFRTASIRGFAKFEDRSNSMVKAVNHLGTESKLFESPSAYLDSINLRKYYGMILYVNTKSTEVNGTTLFKDIVIYCDFSKRYAKRYASICERGLEFCPEIRGIAETYDETEGSLETILTDISIAGLGNRRYGISMDVDNDIVTTGSYLIQNLEKAKELFQKLDEECLADNHSIDTVPRLSKIPNPYYQDLDSGKKLLLGWRDIIPKLDDVENYITIK